MNDSSNCNGFASGNNNLEKNKMNFTIDMNDFYTISSNNNNNNNNNINDTQDQYNSFIKSITNNYLETINYENIFFDKIMKNI